MIVFATYSCRPNLVYHHPHHEKHSAPGDIEAHGAWVG